MSFHNYKKEKNQMMFQYTFEWEVNEISISLC